MLGKYWNTAHQKLREALASPLLRNSVNLMLASGLTAAFGFLFWIIVARGFDASTVGAAGTLLSMSTLLSLLGLVGFDVIFVRFLGKATNKNKQINTGMILAGVTSTVIALLFAAIAPSISHEFAFIHDNPWYIAAFVALTLSSSWITLTNALFVAHRKTSVVLVASMLFGAIKIGLPFLFSSGGAIVIFCIIGIVQVMNVIFNIGALKKYFAYKPALAIDKTILRSVFRFGSVAYLSNIMNLLPASLMPLFVIHILGASAAAYYYMAFALANLLYTIIYSTNQVLLAEASNSTESVGYHVRKSLRTISIILVPAITLLYILCPYLLGLFGQGYADGAVATLRIMCLTGILVTCGSLLDFAFKHAKNLKAMITSNSTRSIVAIGSAPLLASLLGLPGIGVALMLGSLASVITGLVFIFRSRNANTLDQSLKRSTYETA